MPSGTLSGRQPSKRTKGTASFEAAGWIMASALYQPFRAIGYVCADVPLNVQARGNVHALTASVGNSFHIYDGEKLKLLFTGPQNAGPVTAVAAFKDRIFSACSNVISVAERGKEIARWEANAACKIFSLLVFGNLILALCDDNVLRIWDHSTGEYYNELSFPDSFRVSAVLHPSTYLNKVLLASQQGTMQLWNIRTLTMLYEFASLESPIVYFTQAPAVDVVAIGLLDGSTVLHNIRADVEIMRLKQDGKVTAISFRTDEKQHMVTASISGDLTVWDLSKQQVLNVTSGAHAGAIHTAHYYAGQPILITAGADNAIRQWIFDSAEGHPRLLRHRGGHQTPPTRIHYHPLEQHQIITAGADQAIRVFNIARDANCMEIPLFDKKLKGWAAEDARIPPVAQFAISEETLHKSVNIITAHVKDLNARICSYGGKPLDKRVFTCTDGSLVKSVAISACGNFGFVGSALGGVDRYNLQSGLLRKTYGQSGGGHTKAVIGIVTDRVNRLVITAGLDGLVKFWSFQSASLLHTIALPFPITSIDLHRESNLLCVTTDDFILRIIDVSTHRTVREFAGHRSAITDTAFSPDGRHLISTSTDSTIRTWDLPTGHCVDISRVGSVPRCVAVSANGDYIATAHADQVGIFLWANKVNFGGIVPQRVEEGDEVVLELPTTGEVEEEEEEEEEEGGNGPAPPPPADAGLQPGEEVDDQLIVLSGVPKSKWQNLLSLDALKKRSQPTEAPKADRAPFFLPTLRDQKKLLTATPTPPPNPTQSRILTTPLTLHETPDTEFLLLLRQSHLDADFTDFANHLRDLGPAQLDLSLRLLDTAGGGMEEGGDLGRMVDALVWMMERRRDFEAVESVLAVLVKVHSKQLLECPRLDTLLRRHTDAWNTLEGMFQYGLCLLDFVKTA
ncbi:WD40-repeat-containing domain protein [Fimicolochytrium jonesii]|uniref:WD40-repeat-containing domain protein n=1 Tax=Fimicolochytrium jonesii TaxID=1396493 RepID=UPI0022FEB35A|nr:WD40-repeat-containing domain protein [Fimicolochytrium jonesii]KAI8826544.1 WD40-repeat-containing domain protein [Fimicolochytrium jonesii]